MNSELYKKFLRPLTVLSVLLALTLAVPQRANALMPVIDPPNLAQNTWSAVKNTITAISAVTSAVNDTMMMVREYVLEPIAFVTSGNLVRALTAGVIQFVNGKTNGTGASQFVQSLQNNLQKVSDTQANAFLIQFGKRSGSPFAQSIGSSLQNNYYQQTSLAGFFAKNKNTLPQFSTDPEAFLRGDWSKGGVNAFVALATQPENNPYLLHERAQAQMALMIQDKTSERLNQLAWGGGFMSWCGGTADKDQCNAKGKPGTLDKAGACIENKATTPEQVQAISQPMAGDACIKKDGTPGKIQTPGSTIKATLDKVLGTTADKFVQMGNVSSQINSILSNIASVMDTVNFASGIIGTASVNGLTGGLAGSSDSRPDGGSYMDMYAGNTSGFGVTKASIMQNSSEKSGLNGKEFLTNLSEYEGYWNKIKAQADITAEKLATLKARIGASTCVNKGYTLNAAAIERAVANSVTPAFDGFAKASKNILYARAFLRQMQADATSTDPGSQDKYVDEVLRLQDLSPTSREIANAQQDATETKGAVPDIEDSYALDVSEGSLIDRLILIVKNADRLGSVCFLATR